MTYALLAVIGALAGLSIYLWRKLAMTTPAQIQEKLDAAKAAAAAAESRAAALKQANADQAEVISAQASEIDALKASTVPQSVLDEIGSGLDTIKADLDKVAV